VPRRRPAELVCARVEAPQLATVHRAVRRSRDAPPSHAFRACVGAIHELVTDHMLRHGADTLPQLLDAILEIETALVIDRPRRAR
jgi:hypothetical protein